MKRAELRRQPRSQTSDDQLKMRVKVRSKSTRLLCVSVRVCCCCCCCCWWCAAVQRARPSNPQTDCQQPSRRRAEEVVYLCIRRRRRRRRRRQGAWLTFIFLRLVLSLSLSLSLCVRVSQKRRRRSRRSSAAHFCADRFRTGGQVLAKPRCRPGATTAAVEPPTPARRRRR